MHALNLYDLITLSTHHDMNNVRNSAIYYTTVEQSCRTSMAPVRGNQNQSRGTSERGSETVS